MQEATTTTKSGRQNREVMPAELRVAYRDLDPRRKVHRAGARVVEETQPLAEKPLKAERGGARVWFLSFSCPAPKASDSHYPVIIRNQKVQEDLGFSPCRGQPCVQNRAEGGWGKIPGARGK